MAMTSEKSESVALQNDMASAKSQDLDDLQLQAQGHTAALPRRFTMMSMLAFSFSIMNSWTGVVSILLTNLTFGGPAATFWIPIADAFICGFISLGLAELASAFPSAGGQYHYAFMVAPQKYKPLAGFVTAWLNIFAYLFTLASATIFPAQLIATLAQARYPGYTAERWQIWTIYVALLIIATVVVVFRSSVIPPLQTAFFWVSLLAFSTLTITLLAASPSKQSVETVVLTWTNTSGWTPGLGFMLALGQGMWLYICVDSATHISEEISRPGKYVPRAMILSIVIAVITNVTFSTAVIFSVKSFTDVLESPIPIYEVLTQTINNTGATLFLMIWLIMVYIGCITGVIVTAGRLIWAFARDNGMPFSSYFSHVNGKLEVPVQATVLTCVFAILYGLIYVGSTVAFNTFISTSVLFINISYAIPQGMLIWAGRDKVLPERHLNLGRWLGSFCNIFSVMWMALYTVLFCFPLTLPVTPISMNYVAVVFVAGVVFITAMWFLAGKRTTFTGPNVQLEAVNAVNAAEKAGKKSHNYMDMEEK